MNGITTSRQQKLYNDSKKWGKERHRINIDRARLTVCSVPRDVKRILDLGSGDGLVLNMLKKTGHDPVALDISRIALEHIQSDKLVQGTASSLPFFSNSFDCVIACEVLEHIPKLIFESVLKEMERITKKYIIITVPYKENLKINYARCHACGCVFNGAYHVRSFQEDDMKFLFKRFKCIKIKEIVKILNPDRTFSLELFMRHHLAQEYKYYGPSIKCPLCSSLVNQKTERNWIGWIASGMRYFYRIYAKKKTPLWYLSVYKS